MMKVLLNLYFLKEFLDCDIDVLNLDIVLDINAWVHYTHLGEALAIVMRFVTDDFEIKQH